MFRVVSQNVSVTQDDIINHLDFLATIEAEGNKFYNRAFVKNSLRRYEMFWIPLVLDMNEGFDTSMVPPLGKPKTLIVLLVKNEYF